MNHPAQADEAKGSRLLQDETQTYDSKGLSRWFASRPDARRVAREAAAGISDRRLHPDGGNPR